MEFLRNALTWLAFVIGTLAARLQEPAHWELIKMLEAAEAL